MFELIQSEQFWLVFAAIAPLVASILTAIANLVARAEIASSQRNRRAWASVAMFAHAVVEGFNRGPRSLRGLALAVLAAVTLLLQGCGLLADAPLRDPIEAWCIAEGDRIIAEAPVHDAPQLWAEHSFRCDAALSAIDLLQEAE